MNIIDYFKHIIQAIFKPNSIVDRFDYNTLVDRNTILNSENTDLKIRLDYLKNDFNNLSKSYDKLFCELSDETEENKILRRKLERYYKTGKNF